MTVLILKVHSFWNSVHGAFHKTYYSIAMSNINIIDLNHNLRWFIGSASTQIKASSVP